MSEFEYADDWSWWGTADRASADYSGQGFNSLAPGHGGEFAWIRRLCLLTVKAPHTFFQFFPHLTFSPFTDCVAFLLIFYPRLCRPLSFHRLCRACFPYHFTDFVEYFFFPFTRRPCRPNTVSTQMFKSMKLDLTR